MTAAPRALDLRAEVEEFLSAHTGLPVRVADDMRLLAGGASREVWSVDATLGSGEELALVMRRDLGGAITLATLSRELEFAVIAAAHAAGVPTPAPYFEPGTIGGKPAFFMERVPGEAVGRRLVSDAAFASARALLPEQLAEALAAIHRVPVPPELAERLPRPAGDQSAISVDLSRLYRELDSVDEAHPALELALRWLVLNEPPKEDRTVLVHGDFRIGNLLVDPERGLRAVLDWEFSHLGDWNEDVSWFCIRAWRFGKDALVAGGIAERETWLRAYERASGRRVDRARIDYLEILGNVAWAIGALMQARRHLSGQERNIEFASLGRIAAEMEFEALRLIEAWP